MEERPCLISASRSHFMSKYSENPRGSNPTSPTYPAVPAGALMKGRDLDISALRALDVAGCEFILIVVC